MIRDVIKIGIAVASIFIGIRIGTDLLKKFQQQTAAPPSTTATAAG